VNRSRQSAGFTEAGKWLPQNSDETYAALAQTFHADSGDTGDDRTKCLSGKGN
jgi:hypothetical protein